MIRLECQGAVEVYRTSGRLSAEHAIELRYFVVSRRRSGRPMGVVDLSEIQLMDSLALECLLDIEEHYRSRGGEIRLAAPTPLCREILRATGIADRFAIYTESKLAVGSFVE